MNNKRVDYLRGLLATKRNRVNLRYKYYEMKQQVIYLKGAIPAEMTWMKSTMSWCATAVDTLADRLKVRGFENDVLGMSEIFEMNNADVLYDSAIHGALVSSCDFIYISNDEDGYPKLQVIPGFNATGVIDTITSLLKEGYAVLDCDEFGTPILEAYFLPGETWYIEKGNPDRCVKNAAPYPLLVPVIYRPDAKRPFGHSKISRACMDYTQSAMRTLLRSEVAAEFYSFPQKYVLGTDPDQDRLEKWRATISSMLEITKDGDGDKPVVGQFNQQSMAPYNEQLRMIAGQFAAATGLTLDDLGFSTDNPASAEAIKASHEHLRLDARKAQAGFSVAFKNAGYLASCLRANKGYPRSILRNTKVRWYPIFEPDASMLSLIGDGVIKLNQGLPNYIKARDLNDMTGLEGEEEETAFMQDLQALADEEEEVPNE